MRSSVSRCADVDKGHQMHEQTRKKKKIAPTRTFDGFRHFVIDDVCDTFDVDTTASDVSGHQDIVFALLVASLETDAATTHR